MINPKEVVRMRVPFPNIESGLAVKSHMYVCIKNGTHKEFIKCQSFKPSHILKDRSPFNFIIESSDINRNPFENKTIIDCDKSFFINNIVIDRSLLTTRRKDVCEELFNDIKTKINHSTFTRVPLNANLVVSLNPKVKVK